MMLLFKISNLIMFGLLSLLSLVWAAIVFDLGTFSLVITDFLLDISGQLYQKMSAIPLHEVVTEDFVENAEINF